ncbi:hypothetical protein [Rhodopirellula sp. MGV]|uniref:hypothetical protein n=1 Tax=Rhodopirellula sp. MGV TaxID=2023130 RepID=UPI000B97063E|nr:hypothetical protein [Rhodopirellula sp. MGV]OYP29395.1 hypothetical protein CGZ80_24615 [Rhodopirellula sp. MGV]PNY35701.1 hypothetical protein C2E31_16570 [Rhodopirellula baltica]
MRRRGTSLLEVTIATGLVAMLAVVSASISVDLSRGMSENIARTRLATEARLTVESLRRDLSGCDPDQPLGERSVGTLVGIESTNRTTLRLCFDGDQNNRADWMPPDRVIVYESEQELLIRSDPFGSHSNVLTHSVQAWQVDDQGDHVQLLLTLGLGRFTETYTFDTSKPSQ